MKSFVPLLLAAAFFLSPLTHAQKAPPSTNPAPSAPAVQKSDPDESDLQTHKHYRNSAGQTVHSPSKSKDGKVPAGASAQCRDSTYSFSRSHRGTCSRHGGVAAWL
jgi:Ni/Co efflux regulator RcnB